jgi:hypothetical protein
LAKCLIESSLISISTQTIAQKLFKIQAFMKNKHKPSAYNFQNNIKMLVNIQSFINYSLVNYYLSYLVIEHIFTL